MDNAAFKKAVLSDPTLSPEDRTMLEKLCQDDKFFDKLMQGAMGASVAYAISRFLNLGRKTQILLTVAGFGLGRMLASRIRKQTNQKENDTGTNTIKL